jgi:hypothetical protein
MCVIVRDCSPNRTPTIAQSALPGVTPLAALRAERSVVQALQHSLAKRRAAHAGGGGGSGERSALPDDVLYGELDLTSGASNIGSSATTSRASAATVPMLRVGYGGQWLDVPPAAVALWDRLLLEPYSLRKDVVYYVLYPNNAFIRAHCEAFFRELTVTYQRHSLGSHQPASGDGLLAVPLAVGASRLEYARAVQSVCASIVDDLHRCSAAFVQTCTVVYVVDPFVPGVNGAHILAQQQQQQRQRRRATSTSASNTAATTPTPSSAPQSASAMTRNVAADTPTTATTATTDDGSSAAGSATAAGGASPSMPDDAHWMRMLCDATSALAAHDDREPIHNVTTTLIALGDIVRSTALAATLRDIAFGVCTAARRVLLDSPVTSRPINALSPVDWQKRRLFEPLFVLARPSPTSSSATTAAAISQPSTPHSVLNVPAAAATATNATTLSASERRRAEQDDGVVRDAVHCCYVVDADRLWACVTDASGELLETIVVPCVARGAVEARARALARRRDAFANLWRALVALLAMRTPTASRSLVLCALGAVDDLPVGASSSFSSSSSSSLPSSSSLAQMSIDPPVESSTINDNMLRGDDQLLWHEVLQDEPVGGARPFVDVCLVALQADRRSFAYAFSRYAARRAFDRSFVCRFAQRLLTDERYRAPRTRTYRENGGANDGGEATNGGYNDSAATLAAAPTCVLWPVAQPSALPAHALLVQTALDARTGVGGVAWPLVWRVSLCWRWRPLSTRFGSLAVATSFAPHHSWRPLLASICEQFNDLSWLNVTAHCPARSSTLPLHAATLIRLVTLSL